MVVVGIQHLFSFSFLFHCYQFVEYFGDDVKFCCLQKLYMCRLPIVYLCFYDFNLAFEQVPSVFYLKDEIWCWWQVLSIAKALSIQAHPDKELARVLHKMHPSIYKDSNHKPEMAVALTEFEALCGFVGVEVMYPFCILKLTKFLCTHVVLASFGHLY